MANVIENFMALSNARKIIYLLLVASAVGATFVLFQWAAKPEYQTLYSNLSQEDAASIIEELEKRRIPYLITGGSAISVPRDRLYKTRLELASVGLPRGGGVGFELFDKSGFGMTEFTQRVNYLRAIQGELARTIGWLSEVETARVHIVIPEKRNFFEKEEGASASVVLKLKPGKELNSSQIQGIVHLVASSVTGLNPRNVTVIDTSGQLLTKAAEGDNLSILTSSQLEYQRSLERDIENRIQGILEPAVGSGKVIAKVSADIDFKSVEKTEERFDPDSIVVRSEQRNKEDSLGGGFAAGVPGVLSNIPGGQGLQGAQFAPPKSQRQNEVINYEISKVISRTIEPSGVVKRLSVAVLVDGSYKTVTTPEGKEQKSYVPRTEEEIVKLEELVKGAIGFSAERGDKVEVVNIPFESQVQMKEELEGVGQEPSAFKEYLPSIIRYGTIILLSILLFFFVLRPLITGLFRSEPALKPTERAIPEALKAPEEGVGQKELTAAPMDLKQRVIELARENPRQAAQIIKQWIKEK